MGRTPLLKSYENPALAGRSQAAAAKTALPREEITFFSTLFTRPFSFLLAVTFKPSNSELPFKKLIYYVVYQSSEL